MPAEVWLEWDRESLRRVVRALNAEADGAALKRDLATSFRRLAEPATLAVKAAIRSGTPVSVSPSGRPVKQHAQSMRAAIAAKVRAQVVLGGSKWGVRIKAHRTYLRGFWQAPKRWNRDAGWIHPLFGNRRFWFAQWGKPGWFDATLKPFEPEFAQAAKQALEDMMARIARRA